MWDVLCYQIMGGDYAHKGKDSTLVNAGLSDSDRFQTPAGIGPKRQVIKGSVSLLDLSRTLMEAAGVAPQAKFDGQSMISAVRGSEVLDRGPLLFFCGWHVGVNFACGLEHNTGDGRHFLYAYSCSSSDPRFVGYWV
jgi:arylsulfatase A-like enzyme